MIDVPVVFIIFNRIENTKKVFSRIREVQPAHLYIISDGPRESVEAESEKVCRTRAVTENIDWNCVVKRNYSTYNMGCRDRIVSGLNWVFSQTEVAVILEDDCYPSLTFFSFCEELLEKYKTNEKVTSIAGYNIIDEEYKMENSYTFSYFHNIWGWATWKRAWDLYDVNMTCWKEAQKRKLLGQMFDRKTVLQWEESYNAVLKKLVDTWDYQWEFAQQKEFGLTVVPRCNMISNIGIFEGTHVTKNMKREKKDERNAMAEEKDIIFPLLHPEKIVADIEYDKIYTKLIRHEAWYLHIKRLIKKIMGKF